jgi:chaperonin GroES
MQNLPTLKDLGFEKLFEDRILVRLESSEQKSKGGLILMAPPGEEKQRIGTVIGFGPGEYDDRREVCIRPIEVQIGDRVMFGKYEGSEISIQGREYYIIRMMGVIGLLSPAKDETAPAPTQDY